MSKGKIWFLAHPHRFKSMRGKHYIINLKLNGKLSVSPSQVSVAEWENGGNYSTEVSNPN